MIDEVCIHSALLEGAKEVFETMIFMDLAECDEPTASIEGEALVGSITFQGDLEGCLTVGCDMACAKAIGINMLGLEADAEVQQEEVNDAIGEVTNMVMGSVKSRLQDSVGELHVSIPMVVSGQGIETRLGEGTTRRALVKVRIDEEYLAVMSFLTKSLP